MINVYDLQRLMEATRKAISNENTSETDSYFNQGVCRALQAVLNGGDTLEDLIIDLTPETDE